MRTCCSRVTALPPLSVCRLIPALFDRVGDVVQFIHADLAAFFELQVWKAQGLTDDAPVDVGSVEARLAQQHDFSVDVRSAVGLLHRGMRPCRCRFPAHVASATDLIAVFEFDPPQTDLSDVAELGAASTFFAVHGFASLVILIADLLSTANTALPSM